MTFRSDAYKRIDWACRPIARFVAFCRRHGLRATVHRLVLSLKRSVSSNRMVLFYYDFPKDFASFTNTNVSQNLIIERKRIQSEIEPQDWRKIATFWNPALCQQNVSARFQRGASLWLVRVGEELAGYGWTMTGGTMAPHYHPLCANDVHLFDFLVFPEFRGQNINPLFVDHILNQMASESRTRAFIEVREWNRSQLSSLRKTKFRLFGIARKGSLFKRTFVEWNGTVQLAGSVSLEAIAKRSEDASHLGLTVR